jgi:hypothetical protein
MKWLFENGFLYDEETFFNAVFNGSFEKTAESRNFEIMKWLMEKKIFL